MSSIRKTIAHFLQAQSFKNASWNLFAAIVYPIIMVVTIPIFLNKLGINQFGIWMLVNSISQSMSVLNMGLGDANIKYISKYRALEDSTSIRKTVSATFGLALAISLVIVAFGFVASLFFESSWFNVPEENRGLTIICIQLSATLFALKFLEIVILSVFQGFERYDSQSQFALSSKICIMLANLFWVFYNGSLVSLLASSVVVQLLFLSIEIVWITKNNPVISFWPNFSVKQIKEILSFGIWAWFQSLLAIVATTVDKFIVAHFSGIETLSYYSIGYMVMTQIHAVFSSFIGWIFPKVSVKTAKGEMLHELFNNAQGITVTFGIISLFLILTIDNSLFDFWLGDSISENTLMFIRLSLFTNSLFLISIVPNNFLNGSGFVKFNTYSELFTKTLIILCMIVGFSLLGNEGLLWGIIVALILSTPVKIVILQRFVVPSDNKMMGFDSVFSSIFFIVFFQSNSAYIKIPAFLLLGLTLYWTFITPSQLLSSFKNQTLSAFRIKKSNFK